MAIVNRVARAWVAIVCIAGFAAIGCGGKKEKPKSRPPTVTSPSSLSSASKRARVLRRKPKTATELSTTSADIWLGNLDGQITELTRLVTERPEIAANVQRLSGAHHTRGRFRGDVDELQLGIDTATTCLRVEPDNANCTLMRGEQQQSLHRFKESRADLESARQLRVDPFRAMDLETELDWNDGLYDKAIAAIHKARSERPSTATWMREAQLDHDLGLGQDEIDTAFETAEDLISDTAPLQVAHLNVQRGIQRAQRGLLEEACVFFREASARMPTYVAANEHLAEALHKLGKDEEAIAIYEKVVAESQDPEFAHALAALYREKAKDKVEQARELEAKARKGYDALLKKYPEAMYWHASELYMDTGDTKRALELLKKNIVLRPNSTSYVALARAELANGRTAEAKQSIDKALAMPVRSASLFWTASRIYRSSGNATASADKFRDEAKRLNPRIEQDEPASPEPDTRPKP